MSAAAVARPQLVPEAELPEAETRLYAFSILSKAVEPDAAVVSDLLTFSSGEGRYALTVDGGDGVVHVKVRWTEEGEVSVDHLPGDEEAEEAPAEKRKHADVDEEQPEQAEPQEEPPSPKKARSSSEDDDDEEFVPDEEDE